MHLSTNLEELQERQIVVIIAVRSYERPITHPSRLRNLLLARFCLKQSSREVQIHNKAESCEGTVDTQGVRDGLAFQCIVNT